ncbi:MAG: hypothetical protein ABR552_04480 [Actinomycetota bacterium]
MKRIILLGVLLAGLAAFTPARADSGCMFVQSVTVCHSYDASTSRPQGEVVVYDRYTGNNLDVGAFAFDDSYYTLIGIYGFGRVNAIPAGGGISVIRDKSSGGIYHDEAAIAGPCSVDENGWLFTPNGYGAYFAGC